MVQGPAGSSGRTCGLQPRTVLCAPYVGHHGWVGAWLDVEIDWDEVADLVEERYRMTAPRRLRELLDYYPLLFPLALRSQSQEALRVAMCDPISVGGAHRELIQEGARHRHRSIGVVG